MIIKHPLLIVFFVCLINYSAYAQEDTKYNFSLQEAVTFALDSSYASLNAKRDVAKALKQKWETTAEGLPQINAAVDYENRIQQIVTPVPADFNNPDAGFVNLRFGTQQNMNVSATLSQLIFDGTYIVALQAAKTFLAYSDNLEQQTKLNVRQEAIRAYGNVLVAKNYIDILDNNIAVAKSNLNETRKIYENGFAEEEDVEQLEITYQQLQNQLRNATRNYQLSKEAFKMVLGIPLDQSVRLTDQLENLATKGLMTKSLLDEPFNPESTIDYKVADNLVQQRDLELKREKSNALPSLSGFINYGTVANEDEFLFFNQNTKWFQYSIVGLSIDIPIFSSFRRRAKTQRAKIAQEQAETQRKQALENIKLDYKRAKNDFEMAIDNYHTSVSNLNLAQRIANKNRTKFKEGMATSFELRQAQTQLYSAQNDYLSAMQSVINQKAKLEKVINKPLPTQQ
jgi:outer membrane protein TolC